MKLPLKPGHSSTEFWLTVILGLLTTLISALGMLEVTWGATVLAALGITYTMGRNRLKKIQAEAEAEGLKEAARRSIPPAVMQSHEAVRPVAPSSPDALERADS